MFYTPLQTIYTELQTSDRGLTTDEAHRRQQTYGNNRLDTEKRTSIFSIFFKQFHNFIIYILLFAVAISFILGEMIDVIAVSTILVLNAVIGFVQEWQAERRIQALSNMVPQFVQVYRDGSLVQRSVVDLVPGDVIALEAGSIIPADARIIESSHARVDESSLTGESEPEDKYPADTLESDTALSERINMVYASTLVTAGRITAMVTAIGMQTEIGQIATLLHDTEHTETPLQKQLDLLGKKIGKLVIGLCIGIVVYGVYREGAIAVFQEYGWVAFFDAIHIWITIALSLAVAAVPEGLPAVVTIALSLGVKRMAAKHALVRQLSSVESLGETTVICTDKTGTITQNNMTVQYLATGDDSYPVESNILIPEQTVLPMLLRTGALCTNAHIGIAGEAPVGDPTEVALLAACFSYTDGAELVAGWKRIDELSFDSERKSMSTIDAHSTHGTVVHTKGAIERILDISTHIATSNGRKKLTKKQKKDILAESENFAKDGMRVLACAIKDWKPDHEVSIEEVESGMTYVGMQAMIDPPHDVVEDAIATCHTAGIRVIMITGDNPVTAAAIAQSVGITGDTMLGDEFMQLTDKEQQEAVTRVGVFSRVAPAHKFHIVSVLQDIGEIVAMTGDGVNDAPAIKKADFGIAMGINGTDISKQASDMILLDDNFATIVAAIEEGRNIYQNIRKVINFLLSSNIAEVLIIVLAIVLQWPLPLTAIMILWINLVTDGLPALTLSVDPIDPDSMKKPPKQKEEHFITRHMMMTMGITIVLITMFVLGVFAWARQYYAYLGDAEALVYAQTMAFSTLIFLEIVRITIIRSEQKLTFFSNKWLVAAIIFTFFLHLVVLYTPMSHILEVVPLSIFDWIVLFGIRFLMVGLSRFIPGVVGFFSRSTLTQT